MIAVIASSNVVKNGMAKGGTYRGTKKNKALLFRESEREKNSEQSFERFFSFSNFLNIGTSYTFSIEAPA